MLAAAVAAAATAKGATCRRCMLSSTVQHAHVHITWDSAKSRKHSAARGTALTSVRLHYQQSGKGPLIPENSKGFLVSCVTGKEQLASREAIDLLGQVWSCLHAVHL